MRTTHGLHKCPSCSDVVGEAHQCKPKIKVSFVTLGVMKEWLEKVIISRAFK
jgi:hypothetical protein